MQIHIVVTHHRGEVQCLNIYREVVFSKLNDIFTINKQLFSVLELPNCIFANGLKTTLNVINFDCIFQIPKLVD